jgi:hypothetical protein
LEFEAREKYLYDDMLVDLQKYFFALRIKRDQRIKGSENLKVNHKIFVNSSQWCKIPGIQTKYTKEEIRAGWTAFLRFLFYELYGSDPIPHFPVSEEDHEFVFKEVTDHVGKQLNDLFFYTHGDKGYASQFIVKACPGSNGRNITVSKNSENCENSISTSSTDTSKTFIPHPDIASALSPSGKKKFSLKS